MPKLSDLLQVLSSFSLLDAMPPILVKRKQWCACESPVTSREYFLNLPQSWRIERYKTIFAGGSTFDSYAVISLLPERLSDAVQLRVTESRFLGCPSTMAVKLLNCWPSMPQVFWEPEAIQKTKGQTEIEELLDQLLNALNHVLVKAPLIVCSCLGVLYTVQCDEKEIICAAQCRKLKDVELL